MLATLSYVASSTSRRRARYVHLASSLAVRCTQTAVVPGRRGESVKIQSRGFATIAKTVGTALLPLSLTPAAVVPLGSLVFGAVAVVVARAGVSAICPPPEKKPEKDDDWRPGQAGAVPVAAGRLQTVGRVAGALALALLGAGWLSWRT